MHGFNLAVQALNGLGGCAALGPDQQSGQPRMIEVRRHATADGISQARLGAQADEQA